MLLITHYINHMNTTPTQAVKICRNAARTAWFVIGCPTPDDRRANILTFTATRQQAREWATARGFVFA
jgi:hypothetical protein